MGTRTKVNEAGYRIGDSHPRCKIPDEVVNRIRAMHLDEGMTYPEIGSRLNLSPRTIEGICQFRSRAQLPALDPPSRPHRRGVPRDQRTPEHRRWR